MESITEAFPDTMNLSSNLKSSLYQPDRISLNSVDDATDGNETNNPFAYNSFRIQLQRPCLNVKSLQMLRASIPTPIPSFPENECVFWYYRLPAVASGVIYYQGNPVFSFGPDGGLYDYDDPTIFTGFYVDFNTGLIIYGLTGEAFLYYDLTTAITYVTTQMYDPSVPGDLSFTIQYTSTVQASQPNPNYLHFIRLLPSYYQRIYPWVITGQKPLIPGPVPADIVVPNNQFAYNRQFTDYNDLLTELNLACARDITDGTYPINNLDIFTHIPNDITFYLDEKSKRFYFQGNNAYFYLPAPIETPILSNPTFVQVFQQTITANPRIWVNNQIDNYNDPNGQPYSLVRGMNLRLGYTWNNTDQTGVYSKVYMVTLYNQQNWAQSYGDLVHSADIYIYVSFVAGSSLDSTGNGGLLAVVPLNTAQNCVGFYNNLMFNPCTKIPQQIHQIEIQLKDDAGNPFYLPNSAITNLEVGFQYF